MTYDPTTWVDDGPPCIDAANLNNMEAGIDRAQGDVMNLYGPTAAIPATDPLLIGRLYFESDLLFRVWRDNGAGWDQVHVVAGGAWTLIQEQILGAPAAAVTFAAIPGTYRALKLIVSLRTDSAAERDTVYWQANGDAANNYDRGLEGIGQPVVANLGINQPYVGYAEGAAAVANTFAQSELLFAYYATTDRNKRVIGLTGAWGNKNVVGDLRIAWTNSEWRSLAAIISLLVAPVGGPNLVVNSRLALYGIA